MSTKDTIAYIFYNLAKNKKRIILTCISVVLSITTIMLIDILTYSLKQDIVDKASAEDSITLSYQYTTNEAAKAASSEDADDADFKVAISDTALADFVASHDEVAKITRADAWVRKLFYSPKDDKEQEFGYGFDDGTSKVLLAENEIIIGDMVSYMMKTNLSIGDTLVMDNVGYKIVEILPPPNEEDYKAAGWKRTPDVLFSANHYLKPISQQKQSDELKLFLVNSATYEPEEKTAIVSRITQELNLLVRQDAGIEYFNMEGFIGPNPFEKIIESVANGVLMLGMIVLIVSSIGISNVMYIAVLERKDEIVILKLLGMDKQSVKSIFLLESVFIMIFSSILGVTLSIVSGITILNVMKMPVAIPITDVLLLFGGISCLGILFGYSAAKKGSEFEV